jgi:hypothetical protein
MDGSLYDWFLHRTRPKKVEGKKIEKFEHTVPYGGNGNELHAAQSDDKIKIKKKI